MTTNNNSLPHSLCGRAGFLGLVLFNPCNYGEPYLSEFMKCVVFRTAMAGGGLAYDVYVPVSEVPEQQRPDVNGNCHTTILRGNGDCEYFNFVDATVPAEQRAMEYGMRRMDAWKAHEKKARQIMLRIAQRAFPELNRFGDTLPTLWVNDLMKTETSAVETVEYPL